MTYITFLFTAEGQRLRRVELEMDDRKPEVIVWQGKYYVRRTDGNYYEVKAYVVQ